MPMKSSRILVATVSVAAIAAAGVLVVSSPWSSEEKPAHAARRIMLAGGDDRFPSQTATDWVTYADTVVQVTPVSAEEIPPTDTEVDRGEGMILRDVQLRVDKVLWTRPGFTRGAPDTFDWTAFGWYFDGDTTDRTEVSGEDTPRIEAGHKYVMALAWSPERCSEGDHVPARWISLGADSVIPVDGGVLGQGEEQGEVSTAAEAEADAAEVPVSTQSLEDKVTGDPVAALTAKLQAATPTTEADYGQLHPEEFACN